MHNFAICLIEDESIAAVILREVVKKLKTELPQCNISIFSSSHGQFNVDCGVFCLAELWYFTGEIFVVDTDTLHFVRNLKQDIKINFVFMNQNLDIVDLMKLLDDDVINICLDKSSGDNFYRLTGRHVITMNQYIELQKNIKDQ